MQGWLKGKLKLKHVYYANTVLRIHNSNQKFPSFLFKCNIVHSENIIIHIHVLKCAETIIILDKYRSPSHQWDILYPNLLEFYRVEVEENTCRKIYAMTNIKDSWALLFSNWIFSISRTSKCCSSLLLSWQLIHCTILLMASLAT